MQSTHGCFRISLLSVTAAVVTALAALPHTAMATAANPSTATRVLFVGGSAAHGWLDPQRDSYLEQALASVHATTGQVFDISDRTIPGETASGVGWTRYQRWIRTDHPDVVILSWGLLNDVRQHTPMSQFDASIRYEITLARQSNAEVLMVTPPVTKASATNGWRLEQQYLQAEVQDAQAFAAGDTHVHVIDLFTQMQAALEARHRTYRPYSADWAHPNAAGHRLAGQLLADDLLQPALRASLHP